MYADAGREGGLVYLPPYSPDLNPIEEVFSDLKRFTVLSVTGDTMRDPDQRLNAFLERCVDVVGAMKARREAIFGRQTRKLKFVVLETLRPYPKHPCML